MSTAAGQTLYVTGRKMNALQHMVVAGTPTPTALSTLPIANLYDGAPGTPFAFDGLGGISNVIDFDINQVPNGGGESTFEGGLPTDDWFKSAGATISQEASIVYAGTKSIKMLHTTVDDYLAFDLRCKPGESYNFSGAVYSANSANKVWITVRNLPTGKYWNAATNQWQTLITGFVQTSAAAWQYLLQSGVVLESWATCGYVPEVTIRITCQIIERGDAAAVYFDEVAFWPSHNFSSIHHHNIPTVSAPVTLSALATAGGSVSATLGTYGFSGGTMYVAYSMSGSRYLRWRVAVAPLEDPIELGELVVGQYHPLLRRQEYGQEVTVIQSQDRTNMASDAGPSGVYLRSLTPRYKVRWQLRFFTEVTRQQFQRIMQESANGAYPSVLVMETVDIGVDWRQCGMFQAPKEHTISRPGPGPKRTNVSSFEWEEMGFPVVTP